MSVPQSPGAAGEPRPVSLRRRLLVAIALVTVVTVFAMVLAGFGLLRQAQRQSLQAGLARQADSIAQANLETRVSIIDGLSGLDDPAVLVATIGPDGDVVGSAARLLPPKLVARVLAGRRVSTTIDRGSATYVIQARPVAGGGGIAIAEDEGRASVITAQFGFRMLLVLVLGLVLAVVAAVIASRTITRPLTRLRDEATRLAGGDRRAPAASSRIAEVVEVERAFVALAAALGHSEARQREFLLSISHELRTPLTAIGGYAEALADGLVEPDGVAEVGRTLATETARLTAFTSDLLALARLEADEFRIVPGEVELLGVLRAVATAWGGAARAAGVELRVEASGSVLLVSDQNRVRQLIDGLIENALRVAPADSAIILSAGVVGDRAWIEVRDAGPGITAEDAAVAFERGRLRERYREVRAVGTGLGLSIAARLVERLGGSISARPGLPVGAVFRIELPLSSRSKTAEPATARNEEEEGRFPNRPSSIEERR